MSYTWTLIGVALLAPTQALAEAKSVSAVCKSEGLPIPALQYRDQNGNLKKIRRLSLGKTSAAKYLKSIYSKPKLPHRESELIALANVGNRVIQPEADQKEAFLKFSSPDERTKFPTIYIDTVLAQARLLSPTMASRISNYFAFKDPRVKSSVIRAASGKETGFYGAQYTSVVGGDGKILRQIVLSNNASEPIPYLISLLAHEIGHAETFAQFLELDQESQKVWEARIVDEARAFDIQMKTYVELAQKRPGLFCNWLYVTWLYGDIIVPLSWTMSAMERELRSGAFIDRYAQSGQFEGKTFLLGTDQKLRPDLRKRIAHLHLEFVR